MRYLLSAFTVLTLAGQASLHAQPADRHVVLAGIDGRARHCGDVAMKIWGFAEVGYQEQQSSALLQEQLKNAGFAVKSGVAEIPTASRRSGEAARRSSASSANSMPCRSQAADPERHPLVAEGAGHDLGDVSWKIPTVQLTSATWVPGTPAHSWQAVAAGGTSIGVRGMLVAAKSMALTAIDLFTDPTHIQQARAEFDTRRGPDLKYTTRLGERKPALDYRK